ncbi:MAG: hypothetical protein V4547_16980 [Bacteroidota bacterium]
MIPNYITYREQDNSGRLCYYILQKAYPHFIGIISVGQLENSLCSIPIANYNLYVNFHATLVGRFLPSYKDVLEDIELSMAGMADWFYHNRILADYKKYNKFKILNDTTNSTTG